MLFHPGFFHVVVHLFYLSQYAICAIGMALGLMSYQGRHKGATGHFDRFLNLHTAIHFRILIYNCIQIIRSLCSMVHNESSVGLSSFLYYIKDGFSITVLFALVLMLISKATTNKSHKRIIEYVQLGIDVVVFVVTLFFGFMKIIFMDWDNPDMEYSQGMILYDLLYVVVIAGMTITFCAAVLLNFKNNRNLITARVLIIILAFLELIFCLQIQRWMVIFGAFDLSNHLLQEFILAIYRFFGLGINVWILVVFWNKKDFFIAETHDKLEIIPSGKDDEGAPVSDEVQDEDGYNDLDTTNDKIEEVPEEQSNPFVSEEGSAYAEI
eukprot:gene854-9103_t